MSGDVAGAILVVIPVLNEAQHLGGVIDALCDDLPTDRRVTVVVADGGSTDGTRAAFDRAAAVWPQLVWLPNPARIQSAAVNLAARLHGEGADVLVRCDAHTAYPPGFVRRLVESLAKHKADAVVVPMDSVGETCFQRAVAWVSDTPAGSGGSAHRGGARSGFVDHGHHAAMRMASFRRAGGYDETFTHNEDAELDCRQRAMGSAIYLDATIRLGYRPRSTVSALWRQYRDYGRGRSRTVRRHPGSMRARQFAVPAHILLCALALVFAVTAPWLLVWPALYLLVLALISVQLALKHRSACGLLAGIAAITMHVAWASGFLSGLAFIREPAWHAAATPANAREGV